MERDCLNNRRVYSFISTTDPRLLFSSPSKWPQLCPTASKWISRFPSRYKITSWGNTNRRIAFLPHMEMPIHKIHSSSHTSQACTAVIICNNLAPPHDEKYRCGDTVNYWCFGFLFFLETIVVTVFVTPYCVKSYSHCNAILFTAET